MRYANAVSFRTALEARLKIAAADSRSNSVNRLRTLVTLERFLARLLEAAPDRWVLKGGVALEFRALDRARATKDLDLWMRESEDSATEAMVQASLTELEDYFRFSVERAGRVEAGQDGATIRFRVRAEVAGRPFETVIVDVGFGGTPVQEPDHVMGTGYLAFAEIAPVRVPTLPLEQHVAEKVHAYTRLYGGAFPSSRVKDLVDLVLIGSFAEFGARELRHALERTFTSRGSHPLPTWLPLPPEDWVGPYQKLASEVRIDSDVQSGHHAAATFLDPVLADGLSDRARWHPARGKWREPET